MTVWRVGAVSDFDEVDRLFVDVAGTEVAVFRVQDRYYAYANKCPHMGGPVCQGRIVPKVEVLFDENGAVTGERFSRTDTHIVCPWHGAEYDITTGIDSIDKRQRLIAYEVQRQGDEVYVVDKTHAAK